MNNQLKVYMCDECGKAYREQPVCPQCEIETNEMGWYENNER